METLAVVFSQPEHVDLQTVSLPDLGAADVLVGVEFSGVSTGTERLLWSGRMPPFPGLGYPLVPGYEAVGQVLEAGAEAGRRAGELVFVPGAKCFGGLHALFGGSASHLVVPGARTTPLPGSSGREGVMLALAATAYHAIDQRRGDPLPELIVGHGALGRLLARLTVALGGEPTVWEVNPARRQSDGSYAVLDPAEDAKASYRTIYDVSGDSQLLDRLIDRLGRGGEIVLAGFYPEPVRFAFPAAFIREARLRIAAEWQPADLSAVAALVARGALDLGGLITHQASAAQAAEAYRQAFTDESCVKMVLDWRPN